MKRSVFTRHSVRLEDRKPSNRRKPVHDLVHRRYALWPREHHPALPAPIRQRRGDRPSADREHQRPRETRRPALSPGRFRVPRRKTGVLPRADPLLPADSDSRQSRSANRSRLSQAGVRCSFQRSSSAFANQVCGGRRVADHRLVSLRRASVGPGALRRMSKFS